MTTIEEIELIVREWAATKPLIREIHLFGSRVKGNARPDSDADLAIKADQRPNDSGATTVHFEAETWESELTKLLGVPADVEELSDPDVSKFVQEASHLIYQRCDVATKA